MTSGKTKRHFSKDMQHITILFLKAIRSLKMLVLSHNEHVHVFSPRKILVSIQKARGKTLNGSSL